MGSKSQKIILFLAAILSVLPLSAQFERRDSLVRLIKATSLELIEQNGRNYRKSVDATFLHNGTYLICDTALWDMQARIINAAGHVKVVQNNTILTSDKMDYIIDQDMVQCRGTLVQLQDKDRNTLRTHFLDYNTRDSLAFFSKGASMRSKDGQIIESIDGSYSARLRTFNFRNDVNMYTDSIFVRTSELDYESVPNKAIFKQHIDFWKDGNMLSANHGWYNRPVETFFFNDHVHAMSENQEVWCDSLYYYRNNDDILMLGSVQVQDTTRNVAAVGNYMFYQDSLSQVTLSKEAAVAMKTSEEKTYRKVDSLGVEHTEKRTRVDTLYFGADTLIYHTVRKCDIPQGEIEACATRLEEINSDPVTAYRRKAAEEAEKARQQQAEEAAKQSGLPPQQQGGKPQGGKPQGPPPAENMPPQQPDTEEDEAPVDTLSAPTDSLAAQADSLLAEPAELDTTKIGFLYAHGNVKVFRYDLQVACDSLRYCDLDSIARLYKDPIVWNEGNRQYTADSLAALVKGNSVDRVSLMSNAFIITQETPELFDQIRSTEVMAYFDTTASLRRFDALGGATAVFFLKEKQEYATVNKVECKMLSALFKDGDLDRIHYFDAPKNDAYPLPQLRQVDRELKGFNWQPDKRPKGKEDITDLSLRPSERSAFNRKPQPKFSQTEIYFPGYMKEVREQLAAAKNKTKSKPKKPKETTEETAAKDSTQATDPLAEIPDSVYTQIGEQRDTMAFSVDSLLAGASDTTAVAAPKEPTKADLREQERARKQAEKEAKWAQLDARDAAKAQAKAEKKAAKARARAERLAAREAKRKAKEDARLERYVERYRKKYENQKPIDDGKDTEQVPEVHESGYPEQRELRDSTLNIQATEPLDTLVQGVTEPGSGSES